MARIAETYEIAPKVIDKFLGLNLTGDTQLKLGESSNMKNCIITSDYKLEKMFGYRYFDNFTASAGNIQGMWYGKLGTTNYFVVAANGKIYKIADTGTMNYLDVSTWINQGTTTPFTEIGTITNAPTKFFTFNNVLYAINGNEYMSWNGTGNFASVEGYVPKIFISAAPATGVGTEFEPLNSLTGKKRMTFNGNATATYKLPETTIGSVDAVYVNGSLRTVTTHYTVDTSTGTVTFTSGNFPATGLDNVEIQWTKGTGDRDAVVKNKGAILFGVNNDNRVFMFGNPSYKNRFIYSELANGVPSAEYFPVTFFNDIGISNTAITDLNTQYDRLIIFKEDETYYATYDSYTLDDLNVVNFPTYLLNKAVGNIPFGQTQLIDNLPFSIHNGINIWRSTQIKDERNAENISSRIEKEISTFNEANIITLDWQSRREYWLAYGKDIFIYNYDVDIFYKLEIDNNVKCWTLVNDELWFGDDANSIYKFSENFTRYNDRYNGSEWDGTAIDMYFETGFYDFGATYLRKNMQMIWLSVVPSAKVNAKIGFITEKEDSDGLEINYEMPLLDNVDFANFSFAISSNVKPYRLKLKAKKFVFIKVKITNNSKTHTVKVLSLILKTEFSGESK